MIAIKSILNLNLGGEKVMFSHSHVGGLASLEVRMKSQVPYVEQVCK